MRSSLPYYDMHSPLSKETISLKPLASAISAAVLPLLVFTSLSSNNSLTASKFPAYAA